MTPTIYPGDPAPPAVRHARAWLEVDLGAIRRNADRLHRAAGVPIVAMVKADGYGLGAVAVARALGADFADAPAAAGRSLWALGVATVGEARELRAAGCRARILCTSPLLTEELRDALHLDVRPSLHTSSDIAAWGALGTAPWHLAIDTGMSRAGVRWNDVAELRDALRVHPPEGVFTHFHSADANASSLALQEARFAEATVVLQDALPRDVLVHCDNSAAIAQRAMAARAASVPAACSPGALARPGIGIYGAFVADALGLEQVAGVRARVVDVRTVRTGETVSYGATYVATQPRRVATLAIGHGDGYRQAYSNRGEVLLRGRRCAVLGVVSMDMTMIDVTDAPCAVGDVTTLLGHDGGDCLGVDAVAAHGGLSPYELLVGLRLRLPRHYLGAS